LKNHRIFYAGNPTLRFTESTISKREQDKQDAKSKSDKEAGNAAAAAAAAVTVVVESSSDDSDDDDDNDDDDDDGDSESEDASGSLLYHFFESMYLVIQVSDSNDKKKTIVHQPVLVMNMFTSLVPCIRLITQSCLETSTIEPQDPMMTMTMTMTMTMMGWSTRQRHAADEIKIFGYGT
jgi:hypothetical protein